MYEYGTLEATADKDKAESLYRAAAGAGSAQGKYYLGLYLIKEVARKHLQEAADLGHSDSAYCINKLQLVLLSHVRTTLCARCSRCRRAVLAKHGRQTRLPLESVSHGAAVTNERHRRSGTH